MRPQRSAIVATGVLDACRCIAYPTIASKERPASPYGRPSAFSHTEKPRNHTIVDNFVRKGRACPVRCWTLSTDSACDEPSRPLRPIHVPPALEASDEARADFAWGDFGGDRDLAYAAAEDQADAAIDDFLVHAHGMEHGVWV